jgi:hypothetical protein
MSTILLNTNELSYTGTTTPVDPYVANRNNLFTVVVAVSNFTGRVVLQGSLTSTPSVESDWFDIALSDDTAYLEYQSDTSTIGRTFKGTIVAVRAKVDRSYLPETEYDYGDHGTINKISINY